ncbi:MAG: ArsR family transcriptional regulator [Promethearchaeota archaeon]|nr:MAG: ArsR family transcriptional regulator [Candidatus Lokiarchaeota archaeon]
MTKFEELNTIVSKFLKVLSDPTRLKMISYLKDNPSTASEIQEKLDLSQSYTSHQLKRLVEVGIIESNREGRIKNFKIKEKSIFKLISILKSYVIKLEKLKLNQLNSLEVTDFEEFF